MTGIAGILHKDGRSVAPSSLARMSLAIAHRGSDAAGSVVHGAIGMAHRMSWRTPEARNEQQPLRRALPPALLVSDARIDNRSELLTVLRVPDGSRATDADLIVAAYERWGSQCVERLVGDFAFALWDGQAHELFCARDPMGVRPFYFFESDRLFAFASEVRALLALPDVPVDFDESAIASFVEGTISERTRTHFKAISRLPAAHAMTVGARRTAVRRYWEPNAQRELRFASTAEYAEAFRAVFGESVRARLRSTGPVGAALSGGLDSSSVVCVARDLLRHASASPLHTFSLVFPSLPDRELRLIDERAYIDRVTRDGGIVPSYIRGDELSPVAVISEIIERLDEPFAAPNLYLHWAMYGAARSRGVGVFLDGFDGDTVVSHGFGRFNGLLMREEWDVFEREVRALSARRQVGARFLLSHFGLPHLARLARRGEWGAWLRAAREITRRFHLARGSVAFDYGLRPALPSAIRGPYRALRGALSGSEPRLHMNSTAGASRAETARREEEDRDLASSEREMHVLGLLQPSYQRTLEIADQSAAAFGIEPRYPFFDRRLIDFCVAVPEVQKLADGWPRLLFRQAMEGILPPEIQWRSDKGNLSPNFHRTVRAAVATSGGPAAGATLDRYVDPRGLERMRQRYCAAATPMARSEDGHALYRSMVLERWLAVRGERPAAAPERSSRPLRPASVV